MRLQMEFSAPEEAAAAAGAAADAAVAAEAAPDSSASAMGLRPCQVASSPLVARSFVVFFFLFSLGGGFRRLQEEGFFCSSLLFLLFFLLLPQLFWLSPSPLRAGQLRDRDGQSSRVGIESRDNLSKVKLKLSNVGAAQARTKEET